MAKVIAQSNIYTAILALALAVVTASAVYVAITSMAQYETLFKVVTP